MDLLFALIVAFFFVLVRRFVGFQPADLPQGSVDFRTIFTVWYADDILTCVVFFFLSLIRIELAVVCLSVFLAMHPMTVNVPYPIADMPHFVPAHYLYKKVVHALFAFTLTVASYSGWTVFLNQPMLYAAGFCLCAGLIFRLTPLSHVQAILASNFTLGCMYSYYPVTFTYMAVMYVAYEPWRFDLQ